MATLSMAPFTPQNLFKLLRECGLYKPEQLAALDGLPPATLDDFPALADKLWAEKLLTPYQTRKVRLNRLHEVLIGNYLVLDKIGEGGMGKVYKAIHCAKQKAVALKVVRAHLMTNPTVMKRYKREAAAVAKLNHPNIVTLLDADEAQGRYFLSFEFVYGSDLSRMVKEFGPLPSPEAAEYVRQAALGLQHAHENGLIHRDVKPSNLLVSGERALPETGGVATVRILDMGLVRSMADDEDLSRSELTRDGTVVGTPDYMAPEQAKNSSTVDHRADLYSLGCTLYYLLKGKPPFPDGSPIDKLLRHQLDPHPDLRKDRPDVPFEMHRLIDRMLAKKPEDRIQTAAEVATALAPFTAEGLANVPDIVLTMPDTQPVVVAGSTVPVVPGGSTLTTVPAQVLEAEVVQARPAAKPKAAPIPSKKPVKLVPREADSADSFPQYGSSGNPRRRDADSDEDSLPPPADETRGRGKETEAALATRRRMAKARLAEKRRKKKANWMPIAAGLGGVALLAVIAVALLVKPGHKPQPSAPEVVAPPPPPPAAKGALPPAWANVPDNATAVVVAYPQAYWPAARTAIAPQSRFVKVMTDLTNRYHFDLRKGERFTFATAGGRSAGGIATVEGDVLTPEWFAQAEKWPNAKAEAIEGRTFLTFPPVGELKVQGLLGAGRPAYTIASDDGMLVNVARRKPTQKPTIPDGMLAALPDPDQPHPPTFTLAAGGQWRLPDGTALSTLGAELVILRARLVDDQFEVDLEVYGTTKERVGEFVNATIWDTINKSYPALKPALVAILRDTSDVGWDKVGALHRLKTDPRVWKMADVHAWLEQLLPD